MATLILTAVGTAIGGPVGGAIGALIGQAADSAIFRPKGREGPRLSELRVQTSTYGTRIPALHGTMRVAGTVIWSTDLIESSQTNGGGKRQPSVTSYTCAASFAVALSCRPISAIGRIWADGNLLRGEAGDFKSSVGAIRVHRGGAGQSPDPLIAAALGEGQASAHRGLAYVVLEDLDLADFGNRIPALTFEVFADEGEDVSVADIASVMLDRPVDIESVTPLPTLRGYACDGEDARSTLAPLVDAFDLRYSEGRSDRVGLVRSRALSVTIHRAQHVARAEGEATQPMQIRRRAIEDAPVRYAQRYYDPARDYQAGVQSVDRPGAGNKVVNTDLPAAIDADTARAVTHDRLQTTLRQRLSMEVSLGWQALNLMIGDSVALEETPGIWRVETVEWAGMVARIGLTPCATGGALEAGTGASGMPVPTPDRAIGPTHLTLIELPADDHGAGQTPLVFAAATGTQDGWRGAALFRMDGENAVSIGAVTNRAITGTALDALAAGPATLLDKRSSVVVTMTRVSDQLVAADTDALKRGANLAMIGSELIQFGAVEPLGDARFRLSHLARGLSGTEWAIAGHEPNEAFVLIDERALVMVGLAADARGRDLAVRAVGPGDTLPAEATLPVTGAAMTPPSPVHPQQIALSNGDRVVRWTRRSRAGWRWLDGADVPMGEESETYRVEIAAADGMVIRTATVSSPQWTYLSADRLTDLAFAPAPLVARVAQIGIWGAGRTLEIQIT